MVFAVSAVVAIILSIKFNISTFLVLSISLFLLICSVVLHFKLKNTYTVLIITVLATFIFTYLFTNYYIISNVEPTRKYIGKEIKITAVVTEEPSVYDDYCSVIVKVNKNKSSMDGIKLLLQYDNFKLKYNDIIEFETKINEQTFTSYYSDNVFLKGYAKTIKIVGNKGKNFYSKAIELRNYISKVFLGKINDDVAGIPIGMLTGNRKYISNEFNQNVKSVGLTHVMAVSGLHISIICLSIVNLIKKKLNNWIPSIIGIVIVVFMSAVAGFSGSILRSGIMCLTMFIGNLFFKRADALNSLGLSITILILINPYNIFSISLILSALGTFGILIFSNKLTEMLNEIYPFEKFLRKPYEYFSNTISVTLTANLFIIPVSIITFGYISTISPIVNLILSPIIFICLVASLLAVLLSWIPIVNTVALFVVEIFCRIFKTVVDYFSSFTFNVFYADDIMLYIFFGLVIGTIILIMICGRTKIMTLVLSLVLCVILPLSSVIQEHINSNKIKYYFPNSAKGLSMVIESNEHFILVVSTTDNYALREIKSIIDKRLLPKIDLIIIPCDKYNVSSKVFDFFKEYGVKEYLLSDNRNYPDAKTLYDCKIEIWDVIRLKTSRTADGYNLYFKAGESTVVFDNFYASANKGDYIITDNLSRSYKINGNKSRYLVAGNYNKNKLESLALNKLGAKAVALSNDELVFATQNVNKELNFLR